jgi:hypothetical protein
MTRTVTIGAAAADMVAGLGTPRGIPRPSVAVGTSVAVRATAIARMTAGARCRRGTMKAGSSALGHATMMMTTGAAAAGMAAGTAIRRATLKPHSAAGKSVKAPTRGIATMTTIAAVTCPRGTTKAGSPARGLVTTTTMMPGAAAADTAVGTAIR